jgi:hypothetical protein
MKRVSKSKSSVVLLSGLSALVMLSVATLGCNNNANDQKQPPATTQASEPEAVTCQSLKDMPEMQAEAKTYEEFLASLGPVKAPDKGMLPMTDSQSAKHKALAEAAMKKEDYSPIKLDDKHDLLSVAGGDAATTITYIVVEHFDASHDYHYYYNEKGELGYYEEVEAFAPCTMAKTASSGSCEYRTLHFKAPEFALTEQLLQRGESAESGYVFDGNGKFKRYDSDGTCYAP